MDALQWADIVLKADTSEHAWRSIFKQLQTFAMKANSPADLHNFTVFPDRFLAESAWGLWADYSSVADRTAARLQKWLSVSSSGGQAVLILDALSLRELRVLLEGATAHGIEPLEIAVTGSDVPSDTHHFAQALGVQTRSALANNHAPSGFSLKPMYTDVLNLPFEDCLGSVPYEPRVFIWHTFIDNMIHDQKSPDQVYKQAAAQLEDEGFWHLVDRMRQGRDLVITGDHGYATSRLFCDEIKDKENIQALRDVFGGSRAKPATSEWESRFMPPLVLTENNNHVVIGQRKWAVQGGFPSLCHGGLSLLEVAVPYVKFPAVS